MAGPLLGVWGGAATLVTDVRERELPPWEFLDKTDAARGTKEEPDNLLLRNQLDLEKLKENLW